MKLKDIEVGKEYAVGTEDWHTRVIVLEIGVYGSVPVGGMSVQSRRSPYKHFVRVQNASGGESGSHYREFLRPWSEQETIDHRKRIRTDAIDTERARVERLHDAAEDLLEALRPFAEMSEVLREGWVISGPNESGELRQITSEDLQRAAAAIQQAEETP